MTDTQGTLYRSVAGAALAVLAAAPVVGAQSAPRADSTSARADAPAVTVIPDRRLFQRSDLYVAGAFIAGTIALLPLDARLADGFRDQEQRGNRTIDEIANTARFFGGPGPLLIGGSMFVVGRLAKVPRMAELALHGTEAVLVGSAVAKVIKVAAGRARPYVSVDTNPHDFAFGRGRESDDYRAFPSGHTTAAFSAAAAVVAETREWWPRSTWYIAPVMFGGATTVGLSRMYHDKHWASDVLMGAAIGTFAGLKTVRFNHTRAGHTLDRILLGTRVVPTGSGAALSWVGGF